MKPSLVKKVAGLTSAMLLASSLSTLTSFADSTVEETAQPISTLENVLTTEDVLGITTDVTLNKEVLSENFNLEVAVASTPSIQEMTVEEKHLFDEIVQEQVSLLELNEEEKQVYEEALVNFFDETSDTYQNLDVAQEELVTEIQKAESDTSTDDVSSIEQMALETFSLGTASAASQVKIGVNFAGSALNVAIGLAVGGGVGAIQAFIIKKGKQEAQRLFTRTVVSRLKAWGANKLATAVGVSVAFAMDYLDIGTAIAKQLDKRDIRPNNGWIDIY
ncbi:MAG: hypothetical protein ACE3JR_01240 [Ectobacillus sp.]